MTLAPYIPIWTVLPDRTPSGTLMEQVMPDLAE
jgi:hypothetical protein